MLLASASLKTNHTKLAKSGEDSLCFWRVNKSGLMGSKGKSFSNGFVPVTKNSIAGVVGGIEITSKKERVSGFSGSGVSVKYWEEQAKVPLNHLS